MSSEAESLVKWINSLGLSRSCGQLSDLADGALINELLCRIAPLNFDPTTVKEDAGNNAVLRESNIRRIVQKLTAYYEDELGQFIEASLVNSSALAKNGDEGEVVKLLELVLGCAVQCSNKQEYISKIMELDSDTQHALMMLIQNIMEHAQRRQSLGGATGSPRPRNDSIGGLAEVQAQLEEKDAEIKTLREDRESISRKFTILKGEFERMSIEMKELENDKKEAAARMAQQEKTLTDRHTAVTESMKAENDRAKKAIENAERHAHELQGEVDAKKRELTEMRNKVESFNELQAEYNKMHDEMDVLRTKAESAEKFERMANKYKEKIASLQDVKLQLQASEETNTRLAQSQAEAEAAQKKIAAMQTQINAYKDQVVSLETRSQELVQDKDRAESKLARAKEQVADLTRDKERLTTEASSLRAQVAAHEEVNSTTGGALSDQLSDQATAALRTKNMELEREVVLLRQSARAASDSEQVASLTSLLDDATRLKAKYEQECSGLRTQVHALEDKLEETQQQAAGNAKIDMLQAENEKIVAQLAERDRQTKAAQAKLGEVEAAKKAAETSLKTAQTQLSEAQDLIVELKTKNSLMGKDQETVINELTAKLTADLTESSKRNVEAAEAQRKSLSDELQKTRSDLESTKAELATAKANFERVEAESKSQAADLTRLFKEKDALNTANSTLKDELLQKERQMSEMQVSMAGDMAKASQGDVAGLTQKIISLQQRLHDQDKEAIHRNNELESLKKQMEELTPLPAKLRASLEERAKLETLLNQAKIIMAEKTRKPDDSIQMADLEQRLGAAERALADKEQEIAFYKKSLNESKESAKREERLIVSAFYGLGLELQRLKAPQRTQAEPQAWLNQQRRKLSPGGTAAKKAAQ